MNLAIKGHATRGKEVIELLEMLGGINSDRCDGDLPNNWNVCYYIFNNGVIKIREELSFDKKYFKIYTLENFLNEFPYKVGDKVIAYAERCIACFTIQDIRWNNKLNKIEYKICSSWCDTSLMQPYKEETMENKPDLLQQLKEYFDNTPREVIEKEWHEYDKYNEIGPRVNEYLKYVSNIRQPKYPKTYIECHELTVQWKECDCNPNSELILCDAPIHDFCKLIVARNIYWKIAGEQMRLGKPWKPDWVELEQLKYCIHVDVGEFVTTTNIRDQYILAFPTEEMRDAFYENFKELIEICKELL